LVRLLQKYVRTVFLIILLRMRWVGVFALELKPLFEAVVKTDKAGKPILEKLKQKKLRPEDYKEQIIKYIRKGEVQFVILTDLKDWFFYSKELTPVQFKRICEPKPPHHSCTKFVSFSS